MMTNRNPHIEPNVGPNVGRHPFPRHKEEAMGKIYYFHGRRAGATNCDQGTNHAPVLIQPHGAIIVIKEPELTIMQVSANTESHFGYAPEELIGQPLSLLLGGAEVGRLRDRFPSRNLDFASQYLEAARIGRLNKVFELLLHRFQKLLILECEWDPGAAISQFELYTAVNDAITQMERAANVRDVCQSAAEEMRRITGFDRAMIYKFNADDSGEVIAESVGRGFESYKELRIANCKLRSGLRTVVDVGALPSPLVPPGIGAPPDLSYMVTRSLSPADIRLLSRLGLKASLFIPINNNDRLWGLIALHHHMGPKYVPHIARMACECVTRFLSTQMSLKERATNLEYIARAIEGHKRLEEIIRLSAELERSNIELDSFAYIASHDLKEPLRGIRKNSDFLFENYARKLDEA